MLGQLIAARVNMASELCTVTVHNQSRTDQWMQNWYNFCSKQAEPNFCQFCNTGLGGCKLGQQPSQV